LEFVHLANHSSRSLDQSDAPRWFPLPIPIPIPIPIQPFVRTRTPSRTINPQPTPPTHVVPRSPTHNSNHVWSGGNDPRKSVGTCRGWACGGWVLGYRGVRAVLPPRPRPRTRTQASRGQGRASFSHRYPSPGGRSYPINIIPILNPIPNCNPIPIPKCNLPPTPSRSPR